MMFGLREEFQYLQCGNCGCLQLEQAPSDPARTKTRFGASILDVGCGVGHLLLRLREEGFHRLTGIWKTNALT
jgi:2-polyprenyl-3-methyl-5-hydroxy-6-metoxy-1,4-benzoquinol methylase